VRESREFVAASGRSEIHSLALAATEKEAVDILRFAPTVDPIEWAAMSLHRCFSSLGCPELSLDAMLAVAAKHGIPLVELRAVAGTLDLPAYFEIQDKAGADLAAQLRVSTVRVAALDSSLHLMGATVGERTEIAALAPWAEALDVRWLRVFDGGKPGDFAAFSEARETLSWWRGLRARHGWRTDLMVETHDALFTAEALGPFLEAFPDVAILWDAHHTWRKGGEDPAVTWPKIRDRVVHVHIKDSIDVPSARHPFTYVLPGSGQFPIRGVLDMLEADNFAGPVSLEWEKLWHPYLPPLDEALATAAKRNWW
jgi:sugar phosphate isomerase/epimerase